MIGWGVGFRFRGLGVSVGGLLLVCVDCRWGFNVVRILELFLGFLGRPFCEENSAV